MEFFDREDLVCLVATLLDARSITRLRMVHSKSSQLKSAQTIRYVASMRTSPSGLTLSTLEQIALAESIDELQTSIKFQYRDVNLQASSYEPLGRFAAVLKRHETLTVSLEGHCGLEAPRIMGYSFTRARANAVKEVLVNHGINESRIDVLGYSNTRPLVWRLGDRQGAENRRVELYVNIDGLEVPKRREMSAYATPPGLNRDDSEPHHQGLDDDVEAIARLILHHDDLPSTPPPPVDDDNDDDSVDLSFLPVST